MSVFRPERSDSRKQNKSQRDENISLFGFFCFFCLKPVLNAKDIGDTNPTLGKENKNKRDCFDAIPLFFRSFRGR